MSLPLMLIAAALAAQVTDRYGTTSSTDQGSSAAAGAFASENYAPLGDVPASPVAPQGSGHREVPAAQAPPVVNDRPLQPLEPFQPTAHQSPQADQAPTNRDRQVIQVTGHIKSTDLMRAMLTTPRNSSLRGRPVTLANVVAGATSRREQADRINAYWDLCSAVADYYLGLGELDEFRNCRNKVRGGQIWQQAEQALSVRIQTSQRAAMASQYRLASLMGRASSMPLPSDLPHCGSYNTRHREIFAGRASAEADELNQLLPLRHAELRAAAGKVMRAKEFLEYVASELRSDSDGQGVVEALELLALQRRAFVQIAKDYNRRIARYSELVAPGEVQAERLVAMLIRSRGTTTATRPAERGSSPSRYGRQSSATAPGEPVTFAAGEAWAPRGSQLAEEPRIDTAVTPVTGQLQQTRRHSREEKSVLVR